MLTTTATYNNALGLEPSSCEPALVLSGGEEMKNDLAAKGNREIAFILNAAASYSLSSGEVVAAIVQRMSASHPRRKLFET